MKRTRIVGPDGVELRSFPEYGAWFGIQDGTLLVCPMLVSGEAELGNLAEVEEFLEPDNFIETMIAEFGPNTFWYPDKLQPRWHPDHGRIS